MRLTKLPQRFDLNVPSLLLGLLLVSGCNANSGPDWLTPMTTGLEDPVLITHAGDGSGELYVVEQPGVIRRFDQAMRKSSVFLDIRKRVRSGGERGLLGLAFHPKFATNGRYFVYYTARNGDNTVSEFNHRTGAQEHKLLEIDDFASNHNGGMIAFGPDALLYIGTGDGGGGGDPQLTAQNTRNLLGKMLRVDVDTEDPAGYRIPPTNPYRDARRGAPEVFAQGLRNPWRFSFDRLSGDLYIGDVGQNAYEEIDFIARADLNGGDEVIDFGWSEMEASHCFRDADCVQIGFTNPILEYSHDVGGCSVTGGYVYRGERAPKLAGKYLYGDYCSGKIWAAHKENGQWRSQLLTNTPFNISAFGESERGDVFVIHYTGGSVYRIDANP